MIQVIWWPLVAGIGLLVLLVAQPLGRPAPTLAQRLASLRPDQRPASPPRRPRLPAQPWNGSWSRPCRPPGGCCCGPPKCAGCPPAG
jgi:hypothetical protein